MSWRSRLAPAGVFMGAGSYERARAAIFGIPLDATTSFRPGSRQGPERIRNVSYVLEEFSLPHSVAGLPASLDDKPFVDLGDLLFSPGHVEGALEAAYEVEGGLLAEGKLPVVLGGEHLVSLPLIRAAAEAHPGLTVVQFDAHADLRADYLGRPYSHAAVMRRAAEVVGADHLYQFGIRSATPEEAAFSREFTHFYPLTVLAPLREVRAELADRPIYLTIDIDVLDPAFAPGTGTPEPGGIDSRELLESLQVLHGLNVVAADVVEVAPVLDPSDRTAVMAAKLVRELLLLFA